MMKRTLLLVGIFTLLLEACTFSVSVTPTETMPATLTPSPTSTLPPIIFLSDTPIPTLTPTFTPTAAPQPSATDTPLPIFTPTFTPTLPCETDTASVVLSTPSVDVKVGDTVKITATITNKGCVALGLPQYRLYNRGDESVFSPAPPEPIVHYLAVGLGQSDSAEFDLQAVASGRAELIASVSYEVHLGYPGPAYWGSWASEPLVITVAP